MKVAVKVKPTLVVEDEAIMEEFPRDWITDANDHVDVALDGRNALRVELNSWDEEGGLIAEQIITRFPRLFPYFFER